jgi:hypothetical protein
MSWSWQVFFRNGKGRFTGCIGFLSSKRLFPTPEWVSRATCRKRVFWSPQAGKSLRAPEQFHPEKLLFNPWGLFCEYGVIIRELHPAHRACNILWSRKESFAVPAVLDLLPNGKLSRPVQLLELLLTLYHD